MISIGTKVINGGITRSTCTSTRIEKFLINAGGVSIASDHGKLSMILGLLLVLLAALFLGCPPKNPIQVKLSFSEPPVLGKPVQFTATFNLSKDYVRDVPDVDASIILSEGFERVDGSLEWKGDIVRGQTYPIKATIKSVKTGTWLISGEAWSESAGANGSKGWYVTVTEDSAKVSDRPPSGGKPVPVQTGPPPPESRAPAYDDASANQSVTQQAKKSQVFTSVKCLQN